MTVFAYILSGFSFLMSILFFIRLKFPQGWLGLFPKLLAGALSPVWAFMGIIGIILGFLLPVYWAVLFGVIGAGMMISYIRRCSRNHDGFEKAFGADWQDRIPAEQTRKMVKRRWTPYLKMKSSPEPSCEQDIAFWKIPDTERELLCDIWRPADGNASGLGFIFFHGGAWYMFDKGLLTRPFFSHLAAQGHTVMDVAYRLCPEVDIYGMTGDVKRAIAWMKNNATDYGIDPEKIIVCGGSAGGHLALLAGYTPQHPKLTPDDIKNIDLSVCGVISYYGPSDFEAEYRHTNQQRLADLDLPQVPIGTKDYAIKRPTDWRLDILLGGWLDDAGDSYKLASPVTHVTTDCPPTLLFQGNQDMITPVDATNNLYKKLMESGVPAINIVYPWTDHAFDVIFPQINPATQSALYDVDRFLGVLLNKE